MSGTLDVDPYLPNAYSKTRKFEVTHYYYYYFFPVDSLAQDLQQLLFHHLLIIYSYHSHLGVVGQSPS